MFLKKLSIGLLFSLMALPGANADMKAAWDKMKTLVGTWECTMGTHKMEMTYELFADGSAILEKHMDMVTVYHPANTDLMLTHYCAAKNQPRLKATDLSLKDNQLQFDFLDVTNTEVGKNHINGLKITFVDQDTVKEEWSYIADGNQQIETFLLKRKKR